MATDFSRTLSLLRQERGISQRKAAAQLGISQALLSHYENGIREPGLAFVVKACDYYHVSADYLLGRTLSRDGAIIGADDLYDSSAEKGTLKGSILATFALSAIGGYGFSGMLLPLLLAVSGILCSILGSQLVRVREDANQMTLLKTLRTGTYTAAILSAVLALPLTYFIFKDVEGVRWSGIYIAILCGMVSGCLIGFFTEYFTSESYRPTRDLAATSQTGYATIVIGGISLGMESALTSILIVCAAVLLSYYCSGGTNEIVDANGQYQVLEEFYDDAEYSLPHLITYDTGLYMLDLNVQYFDPQGREVAEPSEDLFANNCSEAEVAAVTGLAYQFVDAYIAYSSNSNQNTSGNYYRLVNLIVEGSTLQKRMRYAVDGLSWASSMGDELQSIDFHHVMNLGNGYYLCDLTYYNNTIGRKGLVTTENNLKLTLVGDLDSMLVTAMSSY